VCHKKHINSQPTFSTSVGWLAAFKRRYEVKYAINQGDSGSADIQAAQDYLEIYDDCYFLEAVIKIYLHR